MKIASKSTKTEPDAKTEVANSSSQASVKKDPNRKMTDDKAFREVEQLYKQQMEKLRGSNFSQPATALPSAASKAEQLYLHEKGRLINRLKKQPRTPSSIGPVESGKSNKSAWVSPIDCNVRND